jgi:hypothetical protein
MFAQQLSGEAARMRTENGIGLQSNIHADLQRVRLK